MALLVCSAPCCPLMAMLGRAGKVPSAHVAIKGWDRNISAKQGDQACGDESQLEENLPSFTLSAMLTDYLGTELAGAVLQ